MRIGRWRGLALLALTLLGVESAAAQGSAIVTERVSVPARGRERIRFTADSGRGFLIAVAQENAAARVTLLLREPGGAPTRSDAELRPGRSVEGGVAIDASDVVSGSYELIVESDLATDITLRVVHAPVRPRATREGANLRLTAQNLMDSSIAVRFRVGLLGGETNRRVLASTVQPMRLALPLPTWATTVVVDARMAATQWVRFADFALRLGGNRGGAVDTTLLVAATGRARHAVDGTQDSLILWLTPRLVEGTSATSWETHLTIRYEMSPVVDIDPGGSPMRQAARGRSASEVFPMTPAVARPMPVGFDPVVQIVVIDSANDWWRAVRLDGTGGRP